MLVARVLWKPVKCAPDAASDAAPDAQAGASDAAGQVAFQGRRTGRTGVRAPDAPVVGGDVTPGTVPRELGAPDAGVRPMDHLLTRPMRLRVLEELSGPSPDAC